MALGLVGLPRLNVASVKVPFTRRGLAGVMGPVETLGNKLPGSFKAHLAKQISLAGSPKNISVDSLLSVKILAAFVTPIAGFFIFLFLGVAPLKMIFSMLVFSVAAFFIPDLWLSQLIKKRQKAIQLALPDTLDLLTISIEAGLGFDAALSKVAKSTSTVLAEELFRLLQELQLGASRRDAFKALAERTNVPELNSFILAILQADVFGISIGKVLRVQAKEMRVKRRQRAEEMAMKAPVKIVFPLVLCIFPALNIVILGPAAIQIYQNLFLR